MSYLHGNGAVIEQILGKGNERFAQGFIDEKTSEARAIDHEFDRPIAVLFELQRSNVAALVQLHVHHIVANMLDTAISADFRQKIGQLRCIDVVGILLWAAILRITPSPS